MAARKRRKKPVQKDPLLERLDTILTLLQDLLILQGVERNANKTRLGRVAGVRQARVSKISGLFKNSAGKTRTKRKRK